MNKQNIFKTLILSMIFALGVAGINATSVLASVERISVKSTEAKVDEKLAKQNLRNIDLKRIDDPEARKVIGEILRYLQLEAKQ